MSDDTQQPIVVKRIKKGGAAGHGGAWKIAYADFVTAMMAFFLLMWLLGSTAQGDLEGIADYFQNPLKLSLQGGSGVGDSSSVVSGGGEDLTRSVGQVKRGDVEGRRTINLDAATGRHRLPPEVEDATAQERRVERARLIDLKGRIEAIIEADASLRQFRDQILMDITLEGLRIQLIDEHNRPMFLTGSAVLRPYTRDLLHAIGRALNEVPNRISLSGHTDSAPYAGGELSFSNWELSSNRANASRRELLAGGLDSGKVLRVVGLADTIHLNRENPLDPANRRISIIVMNKETEEALRSEGREVLVGGDAPLDPGSLAPAADGASAPLP
ncbi:flagellar motor protein MotB [Pseudothauera nasutitermitis]|uniref:Flagellar motor protein MotB n=1 Tax=Pseudothauera nasutitermitis TaxID=2565930 RepID=A0A4S4B6B8_9RHOO|nr:flagellar motor protein MotB [Pseudothauera nasutitermitis]THF66507.1 flagellar motor protein MotB [Pseudothauera nasutitermitis]